MSQPLNKFEFKANFPMMRTTRYCFRLALAGLILSQALSVKPINNGYFVADHFHYLNASRIRTASVASFMDCAFACMAALSCFSYNLAASPDVLGKLWCELLATDKYNASDKFHPNHFFHHFSIFVSISHTFVMQSVCKLGFQACEWNNTIVFYETAFFW